MWILGRADEGVGACSDEFDVGWRLLWWLQDRTFAAELKRGARTQNATCIASEAAHFAILRPNQAAAAPACFDRTWQAKDWKILVRRRQNRGIIHDCEALRNRQVQPSRLGSRSRIHQVQFMNRNRAQCSSSPSRSSFSQSSFQSGLPYRHSSKSTSPGISVPSLSLNRGKWSCAQIYRKPSLGEAP